MKNIALLFCVAVCALYPLALIAQTSAQSDPLYPAPVPPPITDRARQTKSVDILYGSLQVEVGAQIGRISLHEGNGSKQIVGAYPDILVRYSPVPSRKLDLRLATSYQTFLHNGETVSGLGPISIGMKLYLLRERGLRPAMAFFSSAVLPILSHEYLRPSVVAPSLRIAAAHRLSEKYELGYNLGVEWQGKDAIATGIYALGISIDFSDLRSVGFYNKITNEAIAPQSAEDGGCSPGVFTNQEISIFAEFSGETSRLGGAVHKFNTGFTYGLSSSLTADASAGVGLTKNAPDYFLNAGLSFHPFGWL